MPLAERFYPGEWFQSYWTKVGILNADPLTGVLYSWPISFCLFLHSPLIIKDFAYFLISCTEIGWIFYPILCIASLLVCWKLHILCSWLTRGFLGLACLFLLVWVVWILAAPTSHNCGRLRWPCSHWFALPDANQQPVFPQTGGRFWVTASLHPQEPPLPSRTAWERWTVCRERVSYGEICTDRGRGSGLGLGGAFLKSFELITYIITQPCVVSLILVVYKGSHKSSDIWLAFS